MWKKYFLLVIISCACLTNAAMDVPLFSDMSADIGCSGGIKQSMIQGSGTLLTNVAGLVPVTCTEKHSGTDAIEFKLATGFTVNDWFNFTLKFPGMQQKDLTGYKDLRFFAKNPGPNDFNVQFKLEKWENNTASWSSFKSISVPANTDWTEYVYQLADFGITLSGMNAMIITEPLVKTLASKGMTCYLDDIKFTDGTNTGALVVPVKCGGNVPVGWPKNFVVGSYDKYDDGSSQLAGKVDYRYQYLNYLDWKTYSNGQYVSNYVKTSNAISMGSGFVWYYMGKASETQVYGNFNNATFMQTYFDDYDLALSQMASQQTSPIIIVLEPDAFGFLMQNKNIPSMNAESCSVDMSHATALAGKTYPNNLKGYATYMVDRAKAKLTKGAIVGLLLNPWGSYIPDDIGHGTLDAHLTAGVAQATFLNSLGDGKGDMFFVEKADRDAGTKGATWFWTKENYDKYFAWVKMISALANLRCAGWQVSEGNMDNAITTNKDDAVAYFLAHTADWVNAGFVGILFGPGMDGQANYRNDKGWFLQSMATYKSAPVLLDVSAVTQKKQIYNKSNITSIVTCKNGVVKVNSLLAGSRVALYTVNGQQIMSGIIDEKGLFDVRCLQSHSVIVLTVNSYRYGKMQVMLNSGLKS